MNDFSKEARRERARKAGLAAAAKRREKAVPQVEPQTPNNTVENDALFGGLPEVTITAKSFVDVAEPAGDIAAPVLDRSRVHPEPHDAPVPVQPVSFGAPGRMAARTLAEALEGPAEMPMLAEELARPEKPKAEVVDEFIVQGTDVGAGRVYVAEGGMVLLEKVTRVYGAIPGPGDRLVRYAGGTALVHVPKE